MSNRIQTRDEYGYPTQPDSRRRLRNTLVSLSKRVLLSLIALCMGLFGIYLHLRRLGKTQAPLTPATFHPKRFLVVRVDLIGDLVMSLTVVRALKRTYPSAEIDVLAIPSSAKVLQADPDIAEVIAYDPNIWRRPQALFKRDNWQQLQALKQRLRARHYDAAISVHGPWAALLTILSGATRSIGFGQESYPGLMTDNVPGAHWSENDHIHEVDYCLRLVEKAGVTVTAEDRIPHLFVSEQARTEIDRLLAQENIRISQPIVACHVSSNNGQSKRWPIPYWAKLLDQLIREHHYTVIFTGAPDDQAIITAITQRMQEQPVNMAGKTNLVQLAALLQKANLVITGDSGPMHIAAAVGTAIIAIHGPTDPALSGPVSPHATVLRDPIWCSPCYKAKGAPADCRFFTTQCMKNIQPAQVLDTVLEKLATRHI